MSRLLVFIPLLLAPLALRAESSRPSLGYSGAAADHAGQSCATCHNGSPVNPAGGSVTLQIDNYNPGIQQTIHILLKDAQATSWGFQITIRQVSNEALSAGTFSTSANAQVVCDDGSQFGSAPPCTTARQFAEHSGALRTAVGAGAQFDVPWMPPDQEVGKLNVYVSAVAGNGDGNAGGDHVYTSVRTIANTGSCSLNRKPTVQTIVNGASFQSFFSPGGMATIFGTNFQTSGRTRTAGLGDFVNNGFPPILGCVSVQITEVNTGQITRVPIAYVQQDQINVQLPKFNGTGPVTLQVLANPDSPNQLISDLATFNTQLQAFAPAFFLFVNSTSIAAQAGDFSTIIARPSLVPGARPARPGEVITLYGTGFGDTNPLVPPGQLASGISPLITPILVQIGTVTLAPSDVLYAGLSPGSISGLYQFNVRIPQSTPSGDIPVSINIQGFQTQTGATIPVQP